ncbi:MAG TPA: IPT/TIG domain-containing protein [Phycisphaerales bacterium]|nr:IPT/TIG domain-containing protein [Phycisphaerales bacterium]HMP37945.1 IPT/TIG domain-containing protein [Phycisphaerales bacterium]
MTLSSCKSLAGIVSAIVCLCIPAHAGIACLPPCPADLTADGKVDGADLGILLANWNGFGAGDLDQNGLVDGADLGTLLGSWGDCPSGPGNACTPSDHDCFTTGGPGCDSFTCCELICLQHSACCTEAWDDLCVSLALESKSECQPDAIIIDAVWPLVVAAGETIVITGRNFPADPLETCVLGKTDSGELIGMRPISCSPTEIVAQVGAVPPGTCPVRVMVASASVVHVEPTGLPESVSLIPGTSHGAYAGVGGTSAQRIQVLPSSSDGCVQVFGFVPPLVGANSLYAVLPASLFESAASEGGTASTLTVTVCVSVATAVCVEYWIVGENGEVIHGVDCVHIEAGCCYTWVFSLPASGAQGALEQLAADLATVLAAVIEASTGVSLPAAEVSLLPSGDALLTFPGSDSSFFGPGAYFPITLCLPD